MLLREIAYLTYKAHLMLYSNLNYNNNRLDYLFLVCNGRSELSVRLYRIYEYSLRSIK